VHILAFAKVASVILGWDFSIAIIVALSVICIYTLLGGLYAVAYTDVIQVGIVFLGLIILTPLAINAVGGWDAFLAGVPSEKTQVIPHVASGKVILAYIGAFVMIGLGSVTSPDFIQRAYSAKSPNVAKYSAVCAALIAWVAIGFALCLTFSAGILIDEGTLPGEIINEDPELILPLLIKTIMPLGLVILFMGAALSAVMSAADSSLLALAGMVSKNIIKDVFKPDLNDNGLVVASRILVVIVGVLAMIIAISMPSVFNLVALGFDLILCCLFAPFTLGLFYKKANAYGALAGMLVGVFCRVIVAGYLNGFSLESLIIIDDWYLYTLISPIACFVTMLIVSALTQKQDPPIALKEVA
jgi:high affinity choline transporter 7